MIQEQQYGLWLVRKTNTNKTFIKLVNRQANPLRGKEANETNALKYLIKDTHNIGTLELGITKYNISEYSATLLTQSTSKRQLLDIKQLLR
jgi:hypothetical protein